MRLKVNYYIRQNIVFIRIYGELDQDTVGQVKNKIIEVIDKYNIKSVVFNLYELEFMDSTGIGMIIGRYNQIKKKGGKIILCSLNKQIQKIVMLSGLSRICEIKNSEEESLLYLEEIYEK